MHSEKQQEQAGNDDFIIAMLGWKERALRRQKPYSKTGIPLDLPGCRRNTPRKYKVCFKR